MDVKALDVVKYINEQCKPFGETHVQKLLYFMQGWSLAWDGDPLFVDRIEAWELGPVVPAIRHRSKAAGVHDLSMQQRAVADAVLAQYGGKTGAQLIALTHNRGPWAAARKRGLENGRVDEVITNDELMSFFTEEALAGEGIQRPSTGVSDVYPSPDLDILVQEGAARWANALDLLAK